MSILKRLEPSERDRLAVFARQPAPQEMQALPQLYGGPVERVRGTQIEFFVRLVLEGLNILGRDDSPLGQVRFNKHDVNRMDAGVDALIRIVEGTSSNKDKDTKSVRSALKSGRRMATYYPDKLAAIKQEQARIKDENIRMRDQFTIACAARDMSVIAQMYPYIDGILELENEAPCKGHSADELQQRRYMREKVKVLTAWFKDAEQIDADTVINTLGRQPDFVCDHSKGLNNLQNDHERNLSMYNCTVIFFDQLEKALDCHRAPQNKTHLQALHVV
jgi:hypothetical protein